jgi:transcriptional antiterminator NusG
MNYYALQVKTNGEEFFIGEAVKSLYCAGKQFFFPKRRLRVRKGGKRVDEIKPIFPGYIFLAAEEITPDLYAAVRRIRGFYRFLKDNSDITPFSGNDLDILVKILSLGPVAEISKVYFDENDRIVVTGDGPLRGLEGSIIKVDRRKRRVKVRVDFSYQSFTFDLAYEVVEKVPKDAA